MKNTLAENMLRFGPKNLSELNRKNLKQLTESFTSTNGITYKSNFKDQTTFDAYVKGATPDPKIDILQSSGEGNFGKLGVVSGVLSSAMWHAAAYLGTYPAYASVDAAKIQLEAFQKGISTSNNLSTSLNISNVVLVLTSPNNEWWETEIADPTNPKVKITRWNLWIRTCITPYWSAKKALVLPATTAPK